ncbi:uncharacterized protein LOC143153078 [Ptiloglossa arizonensis]|uniref:uncharacterized protein LOC143153078 n=1 Tax=Ptiloglossa arizonensis TaxID=3350558 RepID=UPI003F9EC690
MVQVYQFLQSHRIHDRVTALERDVSRVIVNSTDRYFGTCVTSYRQDVSSHPSSSGVICKRGGRMSVTSAFRGRSVARDGALGTACRRRSDFKLLSSRATVGSIAGVRRNCATSIREQKK